MTPGTMRQLHNLVFLVQLLAVSVVYSSGFSWGNISIFRKARLKAGGGKRLREKVVESYFRGVQEQNRDQIAACFNPDGTKITDVCALSSGTRIATPFELGERCMEFLAAHPDCQVKFHYPPTCGRGDTRWVFAHWYEEGTWKGISRDIQPDGTPLAVEGQTRFLVNDDLKITEMVVCRTFSDWENQLQAQISKLKAEKAAALFKGMDI